MTRIARPSYGPLNPPLRPANPSDVDTWARWDIAGGRTIYGAENDETAYRELLAYLAPAVGLRNKKLAETFVEDEEAADDPKVLLDAIAAEWEGLWHTSPTRIVRAWREARRLYTLSLPDTGWAVLIEHQDSIDALNRGLSQHLARMGVARLTRGHLCGEVRALTVLAAQWIHEQVLDDGSLPHGICFPSKHADNACCWAVWLRRVDDGHAPETEPTRVRSSRQIEEPSCNPSLATAAEAFGLIVL